MRKIQVQVAALLALTMFSYGIAASVDVFFSAFFLPEEASHHSHSGHQSYCGFVYESPGYLDIHSLPLLAGWRAPDITPGVRVMPAETKENIPLLSASFTLYRFRAPPTSQTAWLV